MDINNQKSLGRKFAFQFLYQLQFKGTHSSSDLQESEILQKIQDFETSHADIDSEGGPLPLKNQGRNFAKKLIFGVLEHRITLTQFIEPLLKKWAINRLNKVDLTLILLGAFELTKAPETPKKVVLNEAIQLGKCFGTTESASFINAILDKIPMKKKA